MSEIILHISQLSGSSPQDVTTVMRFIGVIGVMTYIMTYAELRHRELDGQGMGYRCINMGAAVFALVSLSAEFGLAAAIIQVSFITIGLFGLMMSCEASGLISIKTPSTKGDR